MTKRAVIIQTEAETASVMYDTFREDGHVYGITHFADTDPQVLADLWAVLEFIRNLTDPDEPEVRQAAARIEAHMLQDAL
jgi:hypothetical protein